MTERAPARNGKAKNPGRVPPHNLEAEESLLGAMLLSADARDEAIAATSAAAFYRPIHGDVFDAIATLHLAGEPADPVTVADLLARRARADAVGGLAALLSLQANTPASSNAEHYARTVEDHAILRGLIAAADDIATIAFEAPEDVDAAIDAAEVRLYGVRDRSTRAGRHVARLADALDAWLQRLDPDVWVDPGVPTGLTDLDAKLVGMRPGELIIVGARPSVGKTMFAVHLARVAAARSPGAVLYASAEMGREDVTERFAAQDARVDLGNLRRRRLKEPDWMRLSAAMARLGEANVAILDDPAMTLGSIRAAARRAGRADGGLSMVVVDYLQLLEVDGKRRENRQADVSELSRGAKVMARELDVPVVALSQLSRRVEERADKRPMLADLRESGSLEQDSDAVLLLYRDEVYDPHSDRRGLMEVNVAKQRNGPTGAVTVRCNAATGHLSDVPREDAAEPLTMTYDN